MKEFQAVKNLIFNSEINKSLELAASLVRDINYSDYKCLNVADIEESLIDKVIFSNNITVKDKRIKNQKVLFIISQGYSTGGHTRLMESLSKMTSSKDTLLITRPTDAKVVKRLEGYFDTIIKSCENTSKIKKIFRITEIALEYNKIILNTHPDDIITIVACGIAKKINKELKVYFVNHADHITTYGVTVSDFWFEISIYGKILDKERGIPSKTISSFLGIPIDKPDDWFFRDISYSCNQDGSKFLTAASSNKYEKIKEESIAPLFKEILSMNTKNEISVIGSGVMLNPVFKKLKKEYSCRLKFYDSLPHGEYIKLTESADFYIDSFPMPGGTAFVEQFIHGRPCIGLKTRFFGYTPLEIIKGDTVIEAVRPLVSPISNNFISELQLKVFEVHSFIKVKERFVSNLYESTVFNNPMLDYIEKKSISKSDKIDFSKKTLSIVYLLDKKIFFKLLFSIKFIKFKLIKFYRYRIISLRYCKLFV